MESDRSNNVPGLEEFFVDVVHTTVIPHVLKINIAFYDIIKRYSRGLKNRFNILENQAGAATLKAKRRIGREHPIEVVGEKLRGMMAWIRAGKIVDKSVN